MSRKKSILLAGNWKMNHGPKATREFFAAFKAG
ncbi:MAG: triose-phosphate isomerase, partial [Proteobacteria bacterium]|nr:triose-phosphate isomerase [Pseudomonadota bacterium]